MRHLQSNLPPFGMVFRDQLLAVPTERGRVMFALLASFADRDSGACWPKQDLLADLLGWHVGTVRLALKDLRKAGVLTTQPRLEGGRKQQNEYVLILAPDGSRPRARSGDNRGEDRAPESSDNRGLDLGSDAEGASADRGLGRAADRGLGRDPKEQTSEQTKEGAGLAPGARSEAEEKTDRLNRYSQAVTARYHDDFKARAGFAPPEAFAAILGIVKQGVKEGFRGAEIIDALRRLDERGRPLTKQTLWDEIATARGTNPRQQSTAELEAAALAQRASPEMAEVAAAERALDAEYERQIAEGEAAGG